MSERIISYNPYSIDSILAGEVGCLLSETYGGRESLGLIEQTNEGERTFLKLFLNSGILWATQELTKVLGLIGNRNCFCAVNLSQFASAVRDRFNDEAFKTQVISNAARSISFRYDQQLMAASVTRTIACNMGCKEIESIAPVSLIQSETMGIVGIRFPYIEGSMVAWDSETLAVARRLINTME